MFIATSLAKRTKLRRKIYLANVTVRLKGAGNLIFAMNYKHRAPPELNPPDLLD